MQNATQQICWQDDGGSGGDNNYDDNKIDDSEKYI